MKLAGHLADMGGCKICTKVWLENLKARAHLEDLGVDETLLSWILRRYVGRVWIGFMWLRTVTSGGLLTYLGIISYFVFVLSII
jgi:hypothetical protein